MFRSYCLVGSGGEGRGFGSIKTSLYFSVYHVRNLVHKGFYIQIKNCGILNIVNFEPFAND